jgi:RimJ/RimL family protein N-acetyltransferase
VESYLQEDEAWGQKEIYLLVDSENKKAQQLYEKSGQRLHTKIFDNDDDDDDDDDDDLLYTVIIIMKLS